MPGIYRLRNKYARRFFSIAAGNYVIVHRLKKDTVEVPRVLHEARDPERVFREQPIEE